MSFEMTSADMIGAAGVTLLLVAFALNLIGRLERDGAIYVILNAIGAGLAGYASWLIPYWPFVILEGTWCIVSVSALVMIFIKHKSAIS